MAQADIRALFAEFLRLVDEAYEAFHEWEGIAGNRDNAELRRAAYLAKDRRTEALCRLVAELRSRGFGGVADGFEALYSPSESD